MSFSLDHEWLFHSLFGQSITSWGSIVIHACHINKQASICQYPKWICKYRTHILANNWLNYGPIDWLINWLSDWMIVWMHTCLPIWLIDWLTSRLANWLTDWPTDLLSTGWLADWMNEMLIDWLTDWQIRCIYSNSWFDYNTKKFLLITWMHEQAPVNTATKHLGTTLISYF